MPKEKKKEELDIDSILQVLDDKKEEIFNDLDSKIELKIDDKIEDKMRDYEKKIVRGKNYKIIKRDIVIILLLGIMVYASYYLYTNGYLTKNEIVNNSNNEVNNTVNYTDKIELDKEYYLDNYSYLVDNLFIEDIGLLDIFKMNSVSVNDLSNSLKLKISYANIKNKEVSDESIIFTSTSLLDSYQYLFNDSNLVSSSFTYNNIQFIYYNNMYLGYNNTLEDINIVYNIYNGYTNDSEDIILEVSVAKVVDNNLVNVYDDSVIYSYSGNISDYIDNLSKYKFTFIKNQDNYYFSKMELIN